MTHTIDGHDVLFVPDTDAPAALQAFSERYWAIDRVDDDGVVHWSVRSSELDARPLGDHRPHVIAALGGWLEVDDVECSSCGVSPYRPTSRNSLTTSAGGAGCARCSSSLATAIAEATDPLRQERMRARGARIAEAEAQRRDEHAAVDERRRAVRAKHRLVDDDDRIRLDLEQAMLVLAISHVAREGVVGPVNGSVIIDPRLPAASQFEIARRLHRDGLVRVDPESDLDAFVWEGDKTDRFYLDRVRYVFAGAGSASARFAEARTEAERAILVHGSDEAVRDMIRGCMIGEAIRYLDWRLAKLHMDPADEAHRAQIADALRSRLGQLSIGRLYSAAFTSAGAAATAKVSYGQSRRSSTSTAVNRLVKAIDQALTDGHHAKPYSEEHDVPLAPLTSVLFRMLLGLEPMTATLEDAWAALKTTPGWCQQPQSALLQIRLALESDLQLDPEVVRATLDDIFEETVDWPCGGTCRSHENARFVAMAARRIDDDLVAAGVGGQARARIVLQAAGVSDADMYGLTGGAVVAHILAAHER